MKNKYNFPLQAPFTWHDLISLIDFLSGPEGCPWDGAQTHKSLAPYFIEETYEAIDAIERADGPAMCEELGDVLMQIAFHIVLAERSDTFNRQAVVDGICEKLIRRHSHVFADDVVRDEDDLVRLWTQHKKDEHASDQRTILERVPLHMPALLRAKELQKKAARILSTDPAIQIDDRTFSQDGDGTQDAVIKETFAASKGAKNSSSQALVDRLQINIGALHEAINNERSDTAEASEAGLQTELERQLGAILFDIVRLARQGGMDPELSLQRVNQQFVESFSSSGEENSTMQCNENSDFIAD
ncbi:MAG TPA: MazG family protein [Clostridiaceae bacterium]|nr:MazG family protein [Clostridiaceae bacterium]